MVYFVKLTWNVELLWLYLSSGGISVHVVFVLLLSADPIGSGCDPD